MLILELCALATAVVGVLALSQIVIAYYAYRTSHYNCYGLEPIMTARIDSSGARFNNGRLPVIIEFEVWNRHKYPIVLRQSLLRVAEEVDFNPSRDLISPLFGSACHDVHDEHVAPGGCHQFKIEGTMKTLGYFPAFTVGMHYVDPTKPNKTLTIWGGQEKLTSETAVENGPFMQSPGPIRLFLYRLRERLSGVYSSLQSACQQAHVGVRSLLSRFRITLFKRTASPSGQTEAR